MILPGYTNQFKGVVGGTFDTVVTLYQGVAASVWGGIWSPTVAYAVDTVVIGPDGNAYISTGTSTDVTPVGNNGAQWQALTPLNLTGYSAVFQINNPTATPSAAVSEAPGLILGDTAGTVTINIPPSSTSLFTTGVYDCYLQITDTNDNVYFPIVGKINFQSPLP